MAFSTLDQTLKAMLPCFTFSILRIGHIDDTNHTKDTIQFCNSGVFHRPQKDCKYGQPQSFNPS